MPIHGITIFLVGCGIYLMNHTFNYTWAIIVRKSYDINANTVI